VGRDYPHPEGIAYVRRKWKEALRNPENCTLLEGTSPEIAMENERIIRKAVGRGRYVSGLYEYVSVIDGPLYSSGYVFICR
jgi:hypothetical protein